MNGFVDFHSHFVYGLDDGAQTYEVMCSMLDAAFQNGITALYATPHCVPGMSRFDSALFSERFLQAELYCQEHYYSINLYQGAENLYTPQLLFYIQSEQLICLGNTHYVLIEFSPQISLNDIYTALGGLQDSAYTPVIAHVERYRCLSNIRILKTLKSEFDVKYQMNASTVLEKQSLLQQLFIDSCFKAKLIDHVCSDAHSLHNRPFLMKEVYEKLIRLYGMSYADQLTRINL